MTRKDINNKIEKLLSKVAGVDITFAIAWTWQHWYGTARTSKYTRSCRRTLMVRSTTTNTMKCVSSLYAV